MIRIRQRLDASVLNDIPQEIASQAKGLGLEKRVRPGQSVAVACGSRGIANYDTIVLATVRTLQQAGLEPFIVPAMGSHGAATAEGQKRVLEHSGISEEKMGVPIRSSLETVRLGETEDGIPVLIDRPASEADYVVPVNRVKSHTDFTYEIESGLMKMMAIGLGKRKGAAAYHRAVFNYGYSRVILTVARKVLESGRILFGVGIVENGYCQTAVVRLFSPEELEEGEKALLKQSKALEPHLPFEEVDILVIDLMGKDISGAGIDTKIVGRILAPLLAEEPEIPRIKRIIVRDLTDDSDGNAAGIGLADFVTQKLVDKVDREATYINSLVAGVPEHAKIPLTVLSDREALEAAASTIGMVAPRDLRIIRIKSTKHLEELDVSESYGPEVSGRADLEVVLPAQPLVFDENGNLGPFD
ncbi:MAG: DUF2088 domain-containing protein [Deltaproteobacteria bacterium]|nr:DUF2088 domain-containing protein [Deltaproteobacteria bacterium]